MIRTCFRLAFLALALVALQLRAAPADAATVVYYSAPENAYGWCSGYSLSAGRSCAERYCLQNDGSECQEVATCDDGWGAVAMAGDPYRGFAVACGMGSAFGARAWALSHCTVTANAMCWTDVAFKRNGSTLPSRDNSEFDLIWYSQLLLQIRGYELGDADGEIGQRTRDAIVKFQSDIGVTQTGKLDDDLFTRLLDATGGVGHFVSIIDTDIVTSKKWPDVKGYSHAPKPAPETTMGAELMAMPEARRLTALATMLASSSSKCSVPAKGAQLLGDDKGSMIWSIDCAEGSYTMILNADGTRMTMGGSATVKKDGDEDESSAPPSTSEDEADGDQGGGHRASGGAGENRH
jgi:hypothetical protein